MSNLINRRRFIRDSTLSIAAVGLADTLLATEKRSYPQNHFYLYKLSNEKNINSYDEALAVACIQGIINRDNPVIYVVSPGDKFPDYWLDVLSSRGRWLDGHKVTPVNSLDSLFGIGRAKIKGAVIWDPGVPATVNVATTIAGIADGIVLSPQYAERYLKDWKLPVIEDLRGMFTGKETGSAKNDAYRWAVTRYLSRGYCSRHLLCLYEDAFLTRVGSGPVDTGYVVTRDWAVMHRSFVFDLSPWADEKPLDDPHQPLGTDNQTYQLILKEQLKMTAGTQMTELAGFFSFPKYSNVSGHKSDHHPVATEWETVYLISPYNCYQNTIASSCFNQSFHSHAPVGVLRQKRPEQIKVLKKKTYLCILMADYDSATPLYRFMPDHWDDKRRGEIPLLWGINPNLVETYPDILKYLYETASHNDYFAADASAAGYMNPNRIQPQYMQLFIDHNKKFYHRLDYTISPMVLDWDEPTAAVKDAFVQFSPDGMASFVADFHNNGGAPPKPHVWKGMPVMDLDNTIGEFSGVGHGAKMMSDSISLKNQDGPVFRIFRTVWTSPGQVIDSIDQFKKMRPELDVEVADPYNFFKLFKAFYCGEDPA